MMQIGLTGGMGCGKSQVLSRFAEAGWLTLDTDALVRQLLQNDSAVISEIVDHFGAGVSDGKGGIDRSALATRVFTHTHELDWLEKLLHPRVRKLWMGELKADPERDGVVEIPLLFEKKLEKHFDFTVAVDTDLSTQLARLSRKGITPDMAKPRIARQLSSKEKTERADFVISNYGSLAFLQRQVDRLLKQLNDCT